MVDVLLIMLVFFMVTSTYLNLGMIPIVKSSESAGTAIPAAADNDDSPLMVRLDPDGQPRIRGRIMSFADLSKFLAAHITEAPNALVLIWPSPRPPTQSLVTLTDTLTAAGVSRLRIVQLAPIQ
jgi:biopolymer transport protein ExbD